MRGLFSSLGSHFGIIFVLGWWLFWLLIHNTQMSGVIVADIYYQFHFLLMLLGMLVGYIGVSLLQRQRIYTHERGRGGLVLSRVWLLVLLTSTAIVILFSCWKSGVFSMGFREYFEHVRGVGSDAVGSHVTGLNLFDFGLKVFVYPALMAVFIVLLLSRARVVVFLVVAVFLIFSFSYLFQVNYPFIFSFFALLLSVHARKMMGAECAGCTAKVTFGLMFVFFVVYLAAANRYGAMDFYGIVVYYFVNYHTLGFYLYQSSIERMAGHDLTLGVSLLGVLEMYFAKCLQYCLSFDFQSIYVHNLASSAERVVAMKDGRDSNAFVTSLFTFYRDFGLVGVAGGGFVYGAFLALLRMRANFWGVIYFYLLLVGVLSIYTSPFEQPYLWAVPFFVWLLVVGRTRMVLIGGVK